LFYTQGHPVADRQDDGTYELTEDFEDYDVEILGVTDQSQLENNVELLASYAVLRDKIDPLKEYTSETTGTYTFDNLEYGAYLVFDKGTVKEDGTVTIVPIFLYLEKDTEAVLKPMDDITTECKVYKVWDDNKSKNRPESIEIQLLQILNGNSEVYDTQTLSDKNNWTYEWTNLPEASYKVIEKKVPSGYTLTGSRKGSTWKLTNKKKTKTPPGDTPNPPGKEKTPPGSEKEKIPKTGQLWWPVPLLLSAGFLCMIIGILRRRKAEVKAEKAKADVLGETKKR